MSEQSTKDPSRSASGGSPPEVRTEQLATEMDNGRGRLSVLANELERRARRVGGPLLIVGVAAFAAAGIALITHAVTRARRRQRTPARLLRLWEALRRMSEHPEQVAEPTPKVSRKIVAAAAASAGSVLARHLAKRLVREPRR
jgi:hypothetical protein